MSIGEASAGSVTQFTRTIVSKSYCNTVIGGIIRDDYCRLRSMDYDNMRIDPAKELVEDGGVTLLGLQDFPCKKIYIYVYIHMYIHSCFHLRVYIYTYSCINIAVENYDSLEGPGKRGGRQGEVIKACLHLFEADSANPRSLHTSI